MQSHHKVQVKKNLLTSLPQESNCNGRMSFLEELHVLNFNFMEVKEL